MKFILIIVLMLAPVLMQAQEDPGIEEDTIVSRFDSRADSISFVVDSMNAKSLEQFKNGYYRLAEETANRVIKTDPTVTWAYMMRGKCRCNLAEKEMRYTRDFEPATDLFKLCIKDLNVYITDRAIARDKDYRDALDRKNEAKKKLKFIRQENRIPR